MSALAASFEGLRERPLDTIVGWLRQNAWILGLLAFLALLLIFTRINQPTYGVAGVRGLAIAVLPLALAAAAQAVVVISGGIDLSIASMMALTSVVAATQMQGQTEEYAVLVAIGVLLLGLTLGAINGALIVFTRVPDIVVTLAMLFVWAGFALLVLRTPGGAAAGWLRDLTRGDLLNEWIPRAAVVLVVVVAAVWLPLRRSRLGLSLYAIGSNSLAAYRSGVSVGRTKIVAYALAGLFAALGGLSLLSTTGNATPVPGPYTLFSVAAVVLGGVSLAGGRGGLAGPILAVVILSLLRTNMTFMGWDTNLATVAQGVILIGVLMFGSLLTLRRSRA
jgi:ribose transport system permease protein